MPSASGFLSGKGIAGGDNQMTEQIGGFDVEHLHGPEEISYAKDELIVLCLVRDGLPWVDAFVEHYSSLGVKHMIFLDNGSTDGTVEALKRYDDATVLRTEAPFKTHDASMRPYLVERFGRNRWTLTVDVDEFFDYPYSDVVPLGSLLGYLNSKSYTAVTAQMLDMFSENRLSERTHERDETWRREHRFYDISGLKRRRMREDSEIFQSNVFDTDEVAERFRGGIRETLFDFTPLLTKYPLLFSDGTMEYRGDHGAFNARVSDFTSVLLHYKFYAFSLQDYWHTSIKQKGEKEDPNRRRVYKQYMDVLEGGPSLQTKWETVNELSSVNDLLDNGFLVASEDYVGWVNAEDERALLHAHRRGEARATVDALLESRRWERAKTLAVGKLKRRLLDLEQQIGERNRESRKAAKQRRGVDQKPEKPPRARKPLWRPDILKRMGTNPRTVVDVGVGRGTPQLYEAFPEAFQVLVEPLKEHEPRLKRILKRYEGEYFLTAVGSSNREATLIVEPTKNQMSSFHERTATTSTGDPTEKRKVPVITLDTLAEQHNLRPPFGLKIDTEGFELEVVQGATDFLRNTQFVIAEVSVTERFVGSYSFPAFTEAMTRNGFFLWDIVHAHERYVDAVFLPSFRYQPTSLLLSHVRLRAKNIVRTIGRRT